MKVSTEFDHVKMIHPHGTLPQWEALYASHVRIYFKDKESILLPASKIDIRPRIVDTSDAESSMHMIVNKVHYNTDDIIPQ